MGNQTHEIGRYGGGGYHHPRLSAGALERLGSHLVGKNLNKQLPRNTYPTRITSLRVELTGGGGFRVIPGISLEVSELKAPGYDVEAERSDRQAALRFVAEELEAKLPGEGFPGWDYRIENSSIVFSPINPERTSRSEAPDLSEAGNPPSLLDNALERMAGEPAPKPKPPFNWKLWFGHGNDI